MGTFPLSQLPLSSPFRHTDATRFVRGVRNHHIAAKNDTGPRSDASIVEHHDGTLEFRFDGQRSASHRDTVINSEMQEMLQDRLSSLTDPEFAQLSSRNARSAAIRLWRVPSARDPATRSSPARLRSAHSPASSFSADPGTEVSVTPEVTPGVISESNPEAKTSTARNGRETDRQPPELQAAKNVMSQALRDWRAARAAAAFAWKARHPSASAAQTKARNLKRIWRDAQSRLKAAEETICSKAAPHIDTFAADYESKVIGIQKGNEDQTEAAPDQGDHHREADGHGIDSTAATDSPPIKISPRNLEREPIIWDGEECHPQHGAISEALLEPDPDGSLVPEASPTLLDLRPTAELRCDSDEAQSADRVVQEFQLRLRKAENASAALQELAQEMRRLQSKLSSRIHNGKAVVQRLEASLDYSTNRSSESNSSGAVDIEIADKSQDDIADVTHDSEGSQEDLPPLKQGPPSLKDATASAKYRSVVDQGMNSIWRSDLGLSYEDIKDRAEMAAWQQDVLSTAASKVAACSIDGSVSLLEMAAAAEPSLTSATADKQKSPAAAATTTDPPLLRRIVAATGLLWLARMASNVGAWTLMLWKRLWWMVPLPLRRRVAGPHYGTRADVLHSSPSISCMLETVEHLAQEDPAWKAAISQAGFDGLGQWRLPGLPLADLSKRRLEQLLDLPITDASLFRAALTSPSALPVGHRITRDFQRLEFLGDAVLGLVVRRALMEMFPSVMEGTLTALQAAVTNGQAVAAMGYHLNLHRFVVTNGFSMAVGGHTAPKLLADCTEALFGAVYLDTGLAAAQQLVMRLVHETVKKPLEFMEQNRQVLLLNLCKKQGLPKPRFSTRISKQDGVSMWQTVGVIGGDLVVESDYTVTKREAKQSAIQMCLSRLRDTPASSTTTPGSNDW